MPFFRTGIMRVLAQGAQGGRSERSSFAGLQGFDKERASKRLTSLIDDKSLVLSGKRAFVPGCG